MKKLFLLFIFTFIVVPTISWSDDGAAIYKRRCQPCHGVDGSGTAMAPAFIGNAFIKDSTDDQIANVIKDGRAGAAKKYKKFVIAMPQQNPITLSSDDVVVVVNYIVNLAGGHYTTNDSISDNVGQENKTYSVAQNLQVKNNNVGNADIDINVDVDSQELFPVLAKFANDNNMKDGFIRWSLHNKSSNTIKIEVSSQLNEWAPLLADTLDLAPNEFKVIWHTPYGQHMLENHNLVPATIMLTATVNDRNVYKETKHIKLRPIDDMRWSFKKPYDVASLIAAWVTPRDPIVEKVLMKAKELAPGRLFYGYHGNVMQQTKAIFNALRNYGISYVNSTLQFGDLNSSQRVRLPRQSIEQKSANCIDGSVLLASLFENIGLEPVIVLVPSHAFVGVRESPGSNTILFIESTKLGRPISESIKTLQGTFDAAVISAAKTFNENRDKAFIIDILQARKLGIYPLQ